MQRPKVDPDTALKVHALIERCRAEGRDVVRALDERGYLGFPALEHWQETNLISGLATILEGISLKGIGQLLPDMDRPMTPYETKQFIARFLHHLSEQQSITKPTEEKQ